MFGIIRKILFPNGFLQKYQKSRTRSGSLRAGLNTLSTVTFKCGIESSVSNTDRLCLQEIPENGPDRAHLEEVHSPAVMAGNVLSQSPINRFLSRVLRHEWYSDWQPSREERHIAHMELRVRNKVFGFNLLEVEFEVTQTGPAFVELRYRCNALGPIEGTFIQMVTPLEPNHNKIVHNFYAEPTLKSKLLSKFLLYGELRMVCDLVSDDSNR